MSNEKSISHTNTYNTQKSIRTGDNNGSRTKYRSNTFASNFANYGMHPLSLKDLWITSNFLSFSTISFLSSFRRIFQITYHLPCNIEHFQTYCTDKLHTIAKLVLNVHVIVFGPCGIVSYDMSVLAKYSMSIDLIQRRPSANHIEHQLTSLLTTTTITTVLQPFFWDHPGKPVPEENFCTLCCKGRLTEADTPTIRLGATPSGLTSAHLHHPPFVNTFINNERNIIIFQLSVNVDSTLS